MIRVCPERDGSCPHGIECPYVIDRYHCKPEGSAPSLPQPEGETAELVERLPGISLSPGSRSFIFALLGADSPDEARNIWVQNSKARIAAHTELAKDDEI